jgi:SAM-dependent methyltransferase
MDRNDLESTLRGSYDEIADLYADQFVRELDGKPFDRDLLDAFAAATPPGDVVCDVGCGPAHIGRYLAARGVTVRGLDLSPEMVRCAHQLNPSMPVQCGSMLNIDAADGTWGGIVAFYSLIHIRRDDVPVALAEFRRVIRPNGRVLASVHAGEGEIDVDEFLGRRTRFIATLFTADELEALFADSGFKVDDVTVRPPYEREYPSQRIYVQARAARRPHRRQRWGQPARRAQS